MTVKWTTRTSRWKWLAMLAGLAIVGGHVRADEPSADPASWVEPRLRFTFTPGLWLPRLTGDSSLVGRDIDLEEEVSLRDIEPTANIELDIVKNDRWMLHFDGFDFSADDTDVFGGVARFGDVVLLPGDRYRAKMDFTSIGGELGIALPWRWPGDDKGRLRLSPLVAVRYVDADQTLERIGGPRQDVSGDWLGVLVGLRLDVQWRPPSSPLKELHLHASSAVGPALGGDGGTMWTVRASATAYLTEYLGLVFGFRLLHVDVEDGDYNLDAGIQGLFVALSLRF